MAFVQAVVQAYQQRGLSPASALATAQIAPEAVQHQHARITALQMELLCAHAMRELDDEALGWFSRRLPWGSYGMLCRASLTAPTLEVALKRWCHHHRLLTEDIVFELVPPRFQQRGSATIRVTENTSLGELREFCLVSTLRYLLGYACWLVDSRIMLTDAAFPFPAPVHADAYAYLFAGPVRFSTSTATISFDARYLALPVRRDEKALQTMLQHALPLTVLQYRRDRLLVHSVSQLLATNPAAAHTADDIAAQLNTSVRTLHRQLKEEGISLQKLKNEVRRERAIKLLLQTSKPVKQVAAAVGFDSEKSFARAFREWTGVAPSAFREDRKQESHRPF